MKEFNEMTSAEIAEAFEKSAAADLAALPSAGCAQQAEALAFCAERSKKLAAWFAAGNRWPTHQGYPIPSWGIKV